MAALQERNGSYRVLFNYRGKQRAFTIGRVDESEAKAKAKVAQVDYLLMRLKQGLIELPPGDDVVAFFMHDGVPPLPRTRLLRPAPGMHRLSPTFATVTSTHTPTARSRSTP